MIRLTLIFLSIVVIMFTIVFVFTKPTEEQTTLERRVAESVVFRGSRRKTHNTVLTLLETKDEGFFGLVDAMLSRMAIFRGLENLIVQGQVKTSAGAVVSLMAGLAFVAFMGVYLATFMVYIAILAAVLVGFIPLGYLRHKSSQRINAFNEALPDCIALCARALRGGSSVIGAIDIVANEAPEPARTEFREVFKKQNYGLSLREALYQMIARVPSMDLQVFVTGVLVQKDSGGNLAEILDRIVSVTRDRMRIQREVRTHTAQGRLTGCILCLLPVVMLGLLNMMSPGYSNVLFHEELGRKMLYGSVALLLVGAFIIRQIVNGVRV